MKRRKRILDLFRLRPRSAPLSTLLHLFTRSHSRGEILASKRRRQQTIGLVLQNVFRLSFQVTVDTNS